MIQVLSYFVFAAVLAFVFLGMLCGVMMLVRKARTSALAYLPCNILAALLVCAVVATDWAQKSGAGLAPRLSGAHSPSMSAFETEGVDFGPMTNLSFTAIGVNSNSVLLSLAWPIGRLTVGDRLEIFSTPSLSDPADLSTDDCPSELNWRWCAGYTIVTASTNVTLSVTTTGDDGLPPVQFYKAVAYPLPLVPDIDGDGLADSVDPESLVAGADAHGTNAEWYDIVCSNVFTKAGEGEPVGRAVVLPNGETVYFREGVNADAYYFVELVAAQGPTAVYFNADHPGRLGAPVVIAQTGDTNLVPLLMGVEYRVTSAVPISVQAPQALYANISTNNPREYSVRWPLDFVAVEDSSGVYVVDVRPYDPGGSFTWIRGTVGARHAATLLATMAQSDVGEQGCPYTVMGSSVEFGCNGSDDCGCGGCTVYATYGLEGTTFYGGSVACGCDDDDGDGDDDGEGPHDPPYISPHVMMGFSNRVVIFEDEYQNTINGPIVPRQSTRTVLSIYADAGTENAIVRIAALNIGKLRALDGSSLDVPVNIELGPWGSYLAEFVCEGVEASNSEDDIFVDVYVENEFGDYDEGFDEMTVIRVSIKEKVGALENPLENRHLYGIGERVICRQDPVSPSLLWSTDGSGEFFDSGHEFECPLTAETTLLYATCYGASLPTRINVIEPTGINCSSAGYLPPSSEATGCGMFLYLDLLPHTVSFSNLKIREVPADLDDWSSWGNHSGYFSDNSFRHRWCHTTAWGAGVWRDVNEFNMLGVDVSRMFQWPQPWFAGSLSWKIPYGWAKKNSGGNTEVGEIVPPSYSVWTMTSSFIEKSKHGHRIGQSISGQFYFDGNIQNGN